MGKYSVIVEIMESVEQVLYSVISVIIVLQMIISSRKVVYLLRQLSLFDVKAKSTFKQPKIKTTNSKIYRFIIISGVVLVILAVLKHGVFFYFVNPITTIIFLYNVRGLVALIIYSLVLIEFSALAFTLKQKFELINKFLLSLNFQLKSGHNCNEVTQKVKFVSQIYNHLCDLSKILCQIFSVPIIFLTFAQVLILISAIFSLVEFGFVNEGPVESPGSVGQDFADILIYFTLTFLLISSSSKTMNEARKTAILAHLLIADNHLSQELHFTVVNFSLQLAHNDVRFTACNFFAIDESLIRSFEFDVKKHHKNKLQVQ
ncbi:uncharacterized protein LOC135139748 [Zophobas morio]|uniref:uncharacterized protein LOC135139748 n=1 Tax=Zophobas morio TaxID=2755281 RepID=UPI003082BC98